MSTGGKSLFYDEMDTRAVMLGIFANSPAPNLQQSTSASGNKPTQTGILQNSQSSPTQSPEVKKITAKGRSKKILNVATPLESLKKKSTRISTKFTPKARKLNLTPKTTKSNLTPKSGKLNVTPKSGKLNLTPTSLKKKQPGITTKQTRGSCHGQQDISPLHRLSTSLLRSEHRRSCVIGDLASSSSQVHSSPSLVKRKGGRSFMNKTTPTQSPQLHRRRSTKMTPLVKDEFQPQGSLPIRRSLKFMDNDEDGEDGSSITSDSSDQFRYKLADPLSPSNEVQSISMDQQPSPRVSPIQSKRKSRSMDGNGQLVSYIRVFVTCTPGHSQPILLLSGVNIVLFCFIFICDKITHSAHEYFTFYNYYYIN